MDRKLSNINFSNQESAVLYYMATFGCITNMDATHDLSITRLSAKILLLRLDGYPIITDEMRSPYMSRYGNHSLYGAYRFARSDEELRWYLDKYAHRMNDRGKIRWNL